MHEYSNRYDLGNVLTQPTCYFCHPKTVNDIANMSQSGKPLAKTKKLKGANKKRKAERQSKAALLRLMVN